MKKKLLGHFQLLEGGHRILKFGNKEYLLIDGFDSPIEIQFQHSSGVSLHVNSSGHNFFAKEALFVDVTANCVLVVYAPEGCSNVRVFSCIPNEVFLEELKIMNIFYPPSSSEKDETALFDWIC